MLTPLRALPRRSGVSRRWRGTRDALERDGAACSARLRWGALLVDIDTTQRCTRSRIFNECLCVGKARKQRAGAGKYVLHQYCTSHSFSSPSAPPEASVRPSGLQLHVCKPAARPLSVARQLPVAASHSRSVLSLLPDAMVRPSGLQAQAMAALLWPVSVAEQLNGAAADHSFNVLS